MSESILNLERKSWLTMDEALIYLCVAKDMLERNCREGKVQYVQTGAGKVFSYHWLDDFMYRISINQNIMIDSVEEVIPSGEEKKEVPEKVVPEKVVERTVEVKTPPQTKKPIISINEKTAPGKKTKGKKNKGKKKK